MICIGNISVEYPCSSQFFKVGDSSTLYEIQRMELDVCSETEAVSDILMLSFSCRIQVSKNGGGKLSNSLTEQISNYFNEKKDTDHFKGIFYDFNDELFDLFNKVKTKTSNDKLEYILMKSKTIGSHETITGSEWVERNSNRMGLDFYTDTIEHRVTPEYQIIVLQYMKDIKEVINSKFEVHEEGYDWVCPFDTSSALDILSLMDIKVQKGNKIYIRDLDRTKVCDGNEFATMCSNLYKDKRLKFDLIDYDSIQDSFIKKCKFTVM